jgi:hypothetical protein
VIGINKASELEVFENTVATLIDITSVLVAYQIGVNKFSFEMGVLYSIFDAVIVVWMRKPISRLVRWMNPFRISDERKAEKK